MKKSMMRILSLFLCLVLCVFLFAVPAASAEEGLAEETAENAGALETAAPEATPPVSGGADETEPPEAAENENTAPAEAGADETEPTPDAAEAAEPEALALEPDENGYCEFSTFEELETLCASLPADGHYFLNNSQTASGEDFVISRDITIPQNVEVVIETRTLILPEDVTLTINGQLGFGGTSFGGNSAELRGTVIVSGGNFSVERWVSLSITGSVSVASTESSPGGVRVPGKSVEIENICLLDNWCFLTLTYDVRNEAELASISALAASNSEDGRIIFEISIKESLTLDSDITTSGRLSLWLGQEADITVPEGITFTNNVDIILTNNSMLRVEGALVNDGCIQVCQTCSVNLADSGKYTGNGSLTVLHDEFSGPSDPFEALPGFDSAAFDVKDDGGRWVLTSNHSELEQLAAPRDLQWHKFFYEDLDENGNVIEKEEQIPGYISWKIDQPSQNQFRIYIYKTGQADPLSQVELHGMSSFIQKGLSVSNFIWEDLDSGEYRFSIKSLGDNVQYRDSEEVFSEPWVYEKPAQQLDSCSKPVLDGKNASWQYSGDLSNVGGYEVDIYYAAAPDTEPYRVSGLVEYPIFFWGEMTHEFSLPDFIFDDVIQRYGSGYYSVRVRALSRDITQYCNGPWSELSEPYNVTQTSREAYEQLTGIAQAAPGAAPAELREQVQAIDREALKTAMLADTENTETVRVMQELEAQTGGAQIVVTENMEGSIPQAQVSMVGAALNTPADEQQPITLVVDKAKTEDVVPAIYDNTVAVRFSMELENLQSSELAVPVKVTLPIPERINPDFLVLLHYHADSGQPEEIWPHIFQQDGQWYASFVLTSFSDFVMTVPAERIPGDVTDDGEVNIFDLLRLKKYLAGVGNASVNMANADVTGDGEVNIFDLLRLKKHLAGMDVTLV